MLNSTLSKAVAWLKCFVRNVFKGRPRSSPSPVLACKDEQGPSLGDRNGLRVREITPDDFDRVAQLLGKGIGYSNSYFLRLLRLMTEHTTPPGFPKYGRVLEQNGSIVGAIILIFSTLWSDGVSSIRCHVTGWCVEPPFRFFAALFFESDLRHHNVTYVNISAQPATIPIIEMQGFTRYSSGQFLAIPSLQ